MKLKRQQECGEQQDFTALSFTLPSPQFLMHASSCQSLVPHHCAEFLKIYVAVTIRVNLLDHGLGLLHGGGIEVPLRDDGGQLLAGDLPIVVQIEGAECRPKNLLL